MSIVSLNTNNSDRRLFLVHGIGGEVESFRSLVAHLPAWFSVYGIKAPERNGLPSPFDNIPVMAEHYIRCLQQVQPHGPYALAGYSFGGSVALEMAKQLAKRNETTKPLVIIDHVPPPFRYQRYPITIPNIARIIANVGSWASTTIIGPGHDLPLSEAIRRGGRQMMRIIKARGRPSLTDTDYVFSPSLSPAVLAIMKVHYGALRRYDAGSYLGQVHLIRASTMPLFRPYPVCFGWRWIASKVKIRVIRGNHTSILKPPLVQQLADAIALAIRDH